MDSCKGDSTSPGRVVKSAVDLDRLIEDFGCWQEVCVCVWGGGYHSSYQIGNDTEHSASDAGEQSAP